MYVLHLGRRRRLHVHSGRAPPVRLRIVGALADSLLQSELIIGEPAFVRLFPRHEGYRVWMIEAPSGQESAVTTHLEDRLSDYGIDVIDTHQRWASYHQVENTYLATFQALGSLGLLLGTVGLGAVLARNVLERRREIGLLRAVGFSPADMREHGAVGRNGAGGRRIAARRRMRDGGDLPPPCAIARKRCRGPACWPC